ncbi:MAG: phytoene/squalene synthase family protein [Sphingomonadaceae bacterium]|nr:phytoene/squalene synthase family protein [Sphingomonadaceae bacterium]
MSVADRQRVVAAARNSIARGSKSFAAASRLFAPATRERAWLLYAWCRACDDIADGQEMGHGMTRVADAQERLSRMRVLTDRALRGEPTGEAAFDAFGIVAAECGITARHAEDLIEGFALDAAEWRPRSEDDLYRYCYHVAGIVGVMMAIVMGIAPDDHAVLDRACDLGMAFQLANIARDIGEDDGVGRCYLPLDWLAEMDIPPGEHMKLPYRTRLAVLAKRLGQRAEAFETSAREGAAALPFRSAWAVLAAAGIYGGIAREVVARGAYAWDARVTTSKRAKLGWITRAFVQAARRGGWRDPPRADLWERPK